MPLFNMGWLSYNGRNEGKRPQGLFRVVHFLPAVGFAVQKISADHRSGMGSCDYLGHLAESTFSF